MEDLDVVDVIPHPMGGGPAVLVRQQRGFDNWYYVTKCTFGMTIKAWGLPLTFEINLNAFSFCIYPETGMVLCCEGTKMIDVLEMNVWDIYMMSHVPFLVSFSLDHIYMVTTCLICIYGEIVHFWLQITPLIMWIFIFVISSGLGNKYYYTCMCMTSVKIESPILKPKIDERLCKWSKSHASFCLHGISPAS